MHKKLRPFYSTLNAIVFVNADMQKLTLLNNMHVII